MRFSIFQDSRIGGRKTNQDRLGYSYSRDALLLVIADGMGGHAHGEIAAEISVTTITKRFQQEAQNAHGAMKKPLEFLQGTFFSAHRAIVAYADEHEMLECPRTTCVACIVQQGKAYWAHSGDSRLYIFRQGKLANSTVDHSRVQQLIDAGLISRDDAAVHPDRNKIYNCLGGVLPPTVTLSEEWPLRVGDTFVLSTDGFWAELPSTEIGERLEQQGIVDLMPQLLEAAERSAGASADNLSVVAMTWEHQDGDGANDPVSTSPVNGFTTSTNTLQLETDADTGDISDDEITRAIDEIQKAIKKVSK